MLNASGTWAGGTAYQTNSGLFIRPIRNDSRTAPFLCYDQNSCEVTYNTSSIKYKNNVIDLTEDTSVLHNIKAREYDSKDNNNHFIGYIAEELNDVSKWFTWKNSDGTPEGIEWFNLVVYSIEEIKKQKLEIQSSKYEIITLKSQISDLINRINVLENK